MALCTKCDVGLNRVALEYVMGAEKADPYMEKYEARILETGKLR
jgi:hypothetical protein